MPVLSLPVLSRWALIGVLVLLCSPWIIPSNKLYHQALALLLWLPALLALLNREFLRLLRQPELIIFVVLATWTLLVLTLSGGNDPVSQAKLPFYVLLSLLGVLLASRDPRWSIELQLGLAALLGGVLAWVSVQYFSLTAPHEPGQRVIAIGLWDKAIMAAHAIGALAVLGCCLMGRVRSFLQAIAVALVSAGYGLFLVLNQSRGVWVAGLAVIVVMTAIRPMLGKVVGCVLFLLAIAAVCWLFPELIIQRGFSFRPELFMGGLQLFEQNMLLGLGFNSYEIPVAALNDSFKHPHNLYLDLAIRLGLPGLALFALLWVCVAWRGWSSRGEPLGRALLALWIFSSVALLTDGIGLWRKPNADWLITWLPVALSLVIAVRAQEEKLTEEAMASPLHGEGTEK
ncbi:O-antigen ligase family protein [Pseudomonas sp. CAU 1711]|uniref:O-antigen ligase family protein n=1 Tax=Pseudomonas sp. CAU 1711 TaxID=3140356 RepID=UPI0032605EC5